MHKNSDEISRIDLRVFFSVFRFFLIFPPFTAFSFAYTLLNAPFKARTDLGGVAVRDNDCTVQRPEKLMEFGSALMELSWNLRSGSYRICNLSSSDYYFLLTFCNFSSNRQKFIGSLGFTSRDNWGANSYRHFI